MSRLPQLQSARRVSYYRGIFNPNTLTDEQVDALFDRAVERALKAGLDRAGATKEEQLLYLTGSSEGSIETARAAVHAYKVGILDATYRFVEMSQTGEKK